MGLLNTLLPTLPPGGRQGAARATLVGWNSAAPLGLQVPGQAVRAETTTLIAGEATVGLPTGTWTLPRYFIGWQVVAGDTNTGYGYGSGQLDFSLSNNPIVFQFVLPPGFQAASLAIGCDLSAYNGVFRVQPALYNWTTGQFDPVLENGQPQVIKNAVNGQLCLGGGERPRVGGPLYRSRRRGQLPAFPNRTRPKICSCRISTSPGRVVSGSWLVARGSWLVARGSWPVSRRMSIRRRTKIEN